jgi:hypothetical protein
MQKAEKEAEEASGMYFYNKINIGTDNEYKVLERPLPFWRVSSCREEESESAYLFD